MRRVANPGFDGFKLGMFEQLAGISLKKWQGTSVHFKAIKQFLNWFNQIGFRNCVQAMSSASSTSPIRLHDLTHPVVAGLISVIVNYGGTFILVFQAAKVAGLSPELTAS